MATFNEPLPRATENPQPPEAEIWDALLKFFVILGLALLALVAAKDEIFSPIIASAQSHGVGAAIYRPSILWFCMGFALLIFRTLLWLIYRPHPPAEPAAAPTMTVVIPAYNEGAMVAHAIDSVASAYYDPACLQIIVVDDGSTDDTWIHIQRAVARHGDRVQSLRLARNSGKRAALAAGFRIATGEILVTVDSDSVVDPKALLALAGPFRSPRVGAVAGKVQVYNRAAGIIPRMLHVRFTLAFDFLRAYQSTFGTVYCTPGALSAYRTSVVMRVLDAWLQQRFLGADVTTGEDRALTNDIMRLGYDSVYQRDAVVFTLVPTGYFKLCRMFLRWDRSYIREEVRFAAVVWKRPPLARALALFDQVITNFRFPVMSLTALLFGVAVFQDPLLILRMFVSLGLISLIYSLYYLRSERSLNIVYGVVFEYFSFFALFWVFPWALITVRSKGWLTR